MSVQELSLIELKKAYKQAVELNLEEEFIKLLEEEIKRRTDHNKVD